MKSIKTLLGLAVLLSIFACEDLEDPKTTAERLAGTWLVEDDEKSINDAYTLEIEIHSIYEDQILIYNFHLLGRDNYVTVDVNDMRLDLPNQMVEGFNLRGSATIASNYKQISWKYFYDDGSGIWEEVNAVYTKKDD